MRRRLVNFATVCSLPLLAAVCVIWLQGAIGKENARIHDWYTLRPPSAVRDEVSISHGSLIFRRLRCSYNGPPQAIDEHVRFALQNYDQSWRITSLQSDVRYWLPRFSEQTTKFAENPAPSIVETGTLRIWILPLWLPAALSALLPIGWARTHLRTRQRARRGLCPNCGYDLRATPDRCPECGIVFSS